MATENLLAQLAENKPRLIFWEGPPKAAIFAASIAERPLPN